MKIGFFGTPDIASFCLEGLCTMNEVVFAVTNEDKAQGRNRHIRFCPTKDAAMCRNIPVLQPKDLNDPAFHEELRSFNVDIFVVVAFGRIIPQSVYNMPPLKTINMHPSLLPLYRGAAPIEWSIINGETETGVTVQLINDDLDAGDIVLQEKIELPKNATAIEMYETLTALGCGMLDQAIAGLADRVITPEPQDHSISTYCGKIDREIARINWDESCQKIHNKIRGLNPKPVAWTTFREKNLKIYLSLLPEDADLPELSPGEISKFMKKRLLVGTSSTPLEIISLQPEGKKVLDSLSFINGSRLEVSDSFI